MARLDDADVLRVLELNLGGLTYKKIVQQTQLDSFAVYRVLSNKKYPSTQRLLAKYPAWLAKNEHLLHKLTPGASSKQGEPVSEYEAKRLQRMGANQAALAALGIDRLGDRKRGMSESAARKAVEREAATKAALKNPRRSSRLSASAPAGTGGRSSRVGTKTEAPLALTREEQNALFADETSRPPPQRKPSANRRDF